MYYNEKKEILYSKIQQVAIKYSDFIDQDNKSKYANVPTTCSRVFGAILAFINDDDNKKLIEDYYRELKNESRPTRVPPPPIPCPANIIIKEGKGMYNANQ